MQYESIYYGVVEFNGPSLMHHGIKGQKWGVRRYQNPDGSLTDAGKKRYSTLKDESPAEIEKLLNKQRNLFDDAGYEMRRTYGKIDSYNSKIRELGDRNFTGKYDKRIGSLQKKVQKNEKKVDAIDKTQTDVTALMNKTIAKALEKNYIVASIPNIKTVRSGKHIAASVLAGSLSGTAVGLLSKRPLIGASVGVSTAITTTTKQEVGGANYVVRRSRDGKPHLLTGKVTYPATQEGALQAGVRYIKYYKDTVKRKKKQ